MEKTLWMNRIAGSGEQVEAAALWCWDSQQEETGRVVSQGILPLADGGLGTRLATGNADPRMRRMDRHLTRPLRAVSGTTTRDRASFQRQSAFRCPTTRSAKSVWLRVQWRQQRARGVTHLEAESGSQSQVDPLIQAQSSAACRWNECIAVV